MKFISLILFQFFLITLITSIKDRDFIDNKVVNELEKKNTAPGIYNNNSHI